MTNLLVSSAGRRGELVLLLKESCSGRQVHTADMSALSSAGCLGDGHHLVPPVRDAGFVDAVLSLCREHDITHVIPTIDPELPVYAAARDRLRAEGITVWVSGTGTIDVSRDKRATHRFLVDHDLPTVRQWRLEESLEERELAFPLIAKPAGGSASAGLRRITSRTELQALPRDEDYVVEEIAAGTEHTVDVLVDSSGRCRAAVPRRRLEVRAGEVSKGVTVDVPELTALAQRVVAALPDAFGVLNLQVFVEPTSGRLNVIEINARFGGGFPLAYRAGLDAPRWLLAHLSGETTPDDLLTWRSDLVMLRYDQGVYLGADEAGLST